VDLPGDYARRKVNAALVPVNPSQRAAIEGLQFALEKIQGPPGTGKSTTIFHILDARLPAGQRVLVTCSRNVAVESIAQKLEGLEDWPLCVFGPRDRVGETARRYLLDSQVGGHLDERRRGKVKSLAQQRGQELREAIAQREARLKGCRRQRFLLGFLKKRHAAAYALRDFCTRLDEYCAKVAAAPKWWEQQAKESKEAVLASARVFLCTIASSSRMLREWEEAMGSELRVHTVIVDECGCTPESSTALLLRIRPSNLVLVGDHKQLPPTSLVQPQLLEGTGHNRSLLERCVLASGRVHQLREQYRMHPSIASVVSGLFYAGRLLTPLSVAQERKAQEPRPLVWMDVQGRDEAPNKSYVNFSEVSACVRVVARIRERVGPGPSVALLTFYKGQLEELMKALPSNLDAEVLTVDACQGSEFDFVILSTVRANREQRLGFVKDAQRICVATSRSRMQLFIVGHRQTLASDGDWRKVAEACLPPKPDEVQPQRPLPASFVSVFDALRKAKEKEAEQKALQAMEEQDAKGRGKSRSPGVSYYGAESLMRQQGSFRGAKTLTRRRGLPAGRVLHPSASLSRVISWAGRTAPTPAAPWWPSAAASAAAGMCRNWRIWPRPTCRAWRLPPDILHVKTISIWGRDLSLQECFSIAFVIGFGAAKFPAIRLGTSVFFFKHRLSILLALLVVSMLASGSAALLPAAWPLMKVLAIFVSSFLSSFLYGGIVTYLEGRRSTEILLAFVAGALVFAGTLSRAMATWLLAAGCGPRWMPLLLGTVACCGSCYLLLLTAWAPAPSARDVELRSARVPMDARTQWKFLRDNFLGIFSAIIVYSCMVGLRSFRDFYTQQIFTAALNGTPASQIYVLADIPGAVFSFLSLVLMSWVVNSQKALILMFLLTACGVAFMAGATYLFQTGAMDGVTWILLYSGGFYTSYSMLNAPLNERIFAATRAEGTCTFLVYASDLSGYVVTIALLMYQSFGPPPSTADTSVLDLFVAMLYLLSLLMLLLLGASTLYFGRGIYSMQPNVG
ncbi:unnamed protein product, partial [Effrenium voratum]